MTLPCLLITATTCFHSSLRFPHPRHLRPRFRRGLPAPRVSEQDTPSAETSTCPRKRLLDFYLGPTNLVYRRCGPVHPRRNRAVERERLSENTEKRTRRGPCRAGRRICLLSGDFCISSTVLLLGGWLPPRMLYLEKQLERDGVTFQILWQVDHTEPSCV